MSDSNIDLSIVVPAYMEARNIADDLEKLAKFLKTRDYGLVEVLVVVADSPDGTASIAASKSSLFANFRVVHAGPRAGKGRDVRLGIFEAKGKYRVFMDADLATPLHHLDDFKSRVIDTGAPVGIAVRNLVSTHKGWGRKLITTGGNALIQLLLLPGLKDTQCGFKIFEAHAAEEIFSRMTILGWGFDLEVLAIARKLHYSIVTVEAPDWSDPKASDSGLAGDSAFGAAAQVLKDLVRVRVGLWIGRYKTPNYSHKPMYT
jgi:dolichyl-phosphate beta-glucosyltransferase